MIKPKKREEGKDKDIIRKVRAVTKTRKTQGLTYLSANKDLMMQR